MLINSITLGIKEQEKTYDLTLSYGETIVLTYTGVTQFTETIPNKSFIFSSQSEDRKLTVNISLIDGDRYLFTCKKYSGILIGLTSETQFIASLLPTARENLFDIVQYLKSRPTLFQTVLGSVTSGVSSFIEHLQKQNLEIAEEIEREYERNLGSEGEGIQGVVIAAVPSTVIQPQVTVQSGTGLASTLVVVSDSQGGAPISSGPVGARTTARGRQSSVVQQVQELSLTSAHARSRSRSGGRR